MINNKLGFTMIELIFVIVVIGILSVVLLPKVMATRNDAKLSIDISNMAICIKDAGGYYTATGIDLKEGDSDACDRVKCFTIIYATEDQIDFNVTTKPTGAPYCSTIDEVGEHLAKTYIFKGTGAKL